MLRSIALLWLAVSAKADLVCYDSSGNQNSGMVVCDPTASVSVCCGWTDQCLGNSLCRTTKNNMTTKFYSNGCSDSTSKAPECAAIVACNHQQGSVSTNTAIKDCGDGEYCCWGNGGCDCSNPSAIFTLPVGSIIAVLPASTAYASWLSTAIASSASSISATANITPTTSVTSAVSTSNAVSGDGHANPHVGLGVGVGVGCALFIGTVVVLYFWRKYQKSRRSGHYAEASPYLSSDHKIRNGYPRHPPMDTQSVHYDLGGLLAREQQDPVQLDSTAISLKRLDARSKVAIEPSELAAS